jgi:hypothetical protein
LDNRTALYAVRTKQGLKVISINTDFYYTPNVFNFFSITPIQATLVFSSFSSTSSKRPRELVNVYGSLATSQAVVEVPRTTTLHFSAPL